MLTVLPSHLPAWAPCRPSMPVSRLLPHDRLLIRFMSNHGPRFVPARFWLSELAAGRMETGFRPTCRIPYRTEYLSV